MQPGVPDQEPRIKTVEHQVNTAKRRLADAATLLVDGTLDRAKYEALRDQQRDVLQAAEAELTRLRSLTIVRSLPPLDTVLREVGGWAQALRSADIPPQHDVLGLLIEHVSANRVGWVDTSPSYSGLRSAKECSTASEHLLPKAGIRSPVLAELLCTLDRGPMSHQLTSSAG
jgi:hypothetical protein